MSDRDLSFPFRYFYVPQVGKIFVPSITIKLNTTKGLVSFNFIVDTGADMTTLPKFVAQAMSINLNSLPQSQAEGLGGHLVKTWLTKIDLHFDTTVISVRASITDENSTPPLLGRVDLLDHLFSWHFDSRVRKIIFSALSK